MGIPAPETWLLLFAYVHTVALSAIRECGWKRIGVATHDKKITPWWNQDSGVAAGGAGCASSLPDVLICEKFGKVSEILSKTLKIQEKYCSIWAKSLRILAKVAPNVCLEKQRSRFAEKQTKTFLEVTPTKGLHDLCERKFEERSCTKTFRESLGKCDQKFFAPPIICLLLHL